MSIQVFDDQQIKKIQDKKSNQLTKAQKKERARQKCLEYKLLKKSQDGPAKGQKQKKLQNFINNLGEGLTYEQTTEQIKMRKQKHKDGAKNLIEACQNDQNGKIIIDLAYCDLMSIIEKRSLSSQINLSVFELRKYQQPFSFHVVGMDDETTFEQIKQRGGESWGTVFHKTSLRESFTDRNLLTAIEQSQQLNENKYSIDWDNTIYLSPDASEPLLDFNEQTNFIIGGLIDRTLGNDNKKSPEYQSSDLDTYDLQRNLKLGEGFK
ncbi:UNKNOWN [Stylonychia lemnae]|uniref:tRNA (guanine(9)-N(1))-methyltransferase n=1 Tax=Stylonychia lemnae TaxID=5949 RepID=A0A078A4X9_STYLE|nr:UNKNOWN [Stylonychia lemnae]|eukprot:CDW76904.1 UNKNOWN [Stylonychia lemnae]